MFIKTLPNIKPSQTITDVITKEQQALYRVKFFMIDYNDFFVHGVTRLFSID